jgi:hypothetical protein
MKATVTIIRHFVREVTINIDSEHIKDLTPGEIGDRFLLETIPYDEELVDTQEFESLDLHGVSDFVKTSRYDIYDDDDKHVYGGHL